MKDILFVNEYVRDKSTAKELFGWWYYKRPLFVVVYIYLTLYFLSIVIGLFISPDSAIEFIPIAIFILIGYVVFAFSYRSSVKAMIDRDREVSGGAELVETVTVTDTDTTVSLLESKTTIALDNMKYAFITKNYVTLVTKARMMVILKKDGFLMGNCDDFIAFLREKGIKIKGKR